MEMNRGGCTRKASQATTRGPRLSQAIRCGLLISQAIELSAHELVHSDIGSSLAEELRAAIAAGTPQWWCTVPCRIS